MKNNYWFFFGLLLFSINAFAQKSVIIEGQVTDSLKKPINSANITIRKGNNQVVAFSYSDEKGLYQIEFVPESNTNYQLVVSSMGYENAGWEIELSKEHYNKNFGLKPKEFVLKEVIIREKIAIKEANDTTSYRADAFRDKNDKVIEDLLKKLPGFEIAKNGNISVNGKAIDKILVEGDDLTNKNYKVISKNLSADLVEKVQVIDKYVEDPLMKGIVSSNRQVLNLTFKADRKSALFGNVELGAGSSERFDDRINLISFLKKAKFYALGNFNTVGKDITGDGNLFEYALENGTNDELFQQNQKNEYVTINEINLPDFQSQQVNFNKAILLSPTFILKPSSKVVIKGNGSFYADKNTLQENSTYNYVTTPPITVIEDKSIVKKPRVYSGNIEVMFYPNPNSRIRFFSNESNALIDNRGSIFNSNIVINQTLGNARKSFENRLFYTHRLDNNAAFSLEMFHLNSTMTQNYEVLSSEKRFLSFLNDSTLNLTQYLTNAYQSSGIVSQYLLKSGENKFSFQLGANKVEEKLGRTLALDSSVIDNQNTLKQNDFALKVKYERGISKLKLLVELPLHCSNLSYGNEFAKNVVFTSPKIGISFKKNDNSFEVLSAYTSKPPQLSDLSKFYILTNYRSFQQGTNDFLQTEGYNFLLNYLHRDLFEQLFINANFSYFKSLHHYNSAFQITNDFNLNSLYSWNVGNEAYNLSLSITKFLSIIGSSIKLKSNLSLFNFQNQLNSTETRNIQSFTSKFEFGLRSAWKKGFNYHIGSELSSNTQLVSGSSNSKNKALSTFAEFQFTFSKKVNAQVDFEQYSFPNSSTNSKSFLGTSLSFEVKPNSLTLSLIAKNLTNNTSFSYNYINDYQRSFRTYNILGRYLMLSANFRF